MLGFLMVVFLSCKLSLASDSLTINVVDDVTVRKLGSSVVLPCWLSPPLDATAMEVRWYRLQKFHTPVLLYLNQKIVTNPVDEGYRNRTSLAVRDAQSTGLKRGDVSLRLDNVSLEDAGIFYCYVSGDKAHNTSSTTLRVAVLGSSPVLSLQPVDGQLNVSCSSCGWYPRPTLKWTSERTSPLRPGGLVFRQEKDGLTCVHSWVLLSPSDPRRSASCSLFLTTGEERDGTVDLQNIAQLIDDGAGPRRGLIAVAVLLAIAICAICFLLYRKYKPGYMPAKGDEEDFSAVDYCSTMETLRKDAVDHCSTMETLRKDAVSITLNRSEASEDLLINEEGNMVRDKSCAGTKDRRPGFPYYLTVPGTNGFSSGRAYWEVGLTAKNTAPKQSWLIGVKNNPSNSFTNDKADLVPSKGFWFLCSDGQNGVHVNTEPEILLKVIRPSPEAIGVLLDYDGGELSFYDAKQEICLFTMKTKFSGKIVPIFNPGISDSAPLSIITITKPSTTSSSCTEPAGGSSDKVKYSQITQDEENAHDNENQLKPS